MARLLSNGKGLRAFLRNHGAAVGVGTVVLAGAVVAVWLFASGDAAPPPRKVAEVTMVRIEQPPPPPPPPPKVEQPIEQPKMVEQRKMEIPEQKPEQPRLKDEPPPKAEDAGKPPGPLGLDAAAEGPGDAFNLAGSPGGRGILGGGGGGGSRWGWYASIVQARIEEALRANGKTKSARTRTEIRLWLDISGRIERARLVSSTGDVDVDRVIESEVLPGLQFREPPPKEMPMPVVVRLTARRPG